MTHYRRPFSVAIPLCATGEGPVSDTMAEVDCPKCQRAYLNERDRAIAEQQRRAMGRGRRKKFR